MVTSKKQLAVLLSKLKPFETPDPSLEQYPTDSNVAASVLWQAYMDENITGKTIADLGAGTGILGIGALLLAAKHVTFIDIDPRVLPILMENLALAEDLNGGTYPNYEIIEGKMTKFTTHVDTVLQNPPFGTRNKGVDVQFLQHAMSIADNIYSLHKTATQEYLERFVGKQGFMIKGILTFEFPLKQTLKQHKRKIHRINVSCLCIQQS